MIALKSSWSKVNEPSIRNCNRCCGYMQAEDIDIEQDNNELSLTANIWDILAGVFCADNVTPFNELVEGDNNSNRLFFR